MKILICDDDKLIIDTLEDMLKQYLNKKGFEFYIDTFQNPKLVIEQNTAYDIAFVDIEMPEINGLEVTKHLLSVSKDTTVFIVTSYESYLDDAMDLNVFRYLGKPVDKNRFERSMDKAIEKYISLSKSIAIEYNHRIHQIFTKDIIYITVENRKSAIITKDNKYTSTNSFSHWKTELLEVDYLVQPHSSYIVNLSYVSDFDKNELRLSTDEKEYLLPISRRYYSSFKNAFVSYIGG